MRLRPLSLAALLGLATISLRASDDRLLAEKPEGILVEMERYDSRAPDDGSFAVPTREVAASGRKTLARFFGDGCVTYRFAVPESAAYHGDIRICQQGMEIAVPKFDWMAVVVIADPR